MLIEKHATIVGICQEYEMENDDVVRQKTCKTSMLCGRQHTELSWHLVDNLQNYDAIWQTTYINMMPFGRHIQNYGAIWQTTYRIMLPFGRQHTEPWCRVYIQICPCATTVLCQCNSIIHVTNVQLNMVPNDIVITILTRHQFTQSELHSN